MASQSCEPFIVSRVPKGRRQATNQVMSVITSQLVLLISRLIRRQLMKQALAHGCLLE
jgi:hypothetical protein